MPMQPDDLRRVRLNHQLTTPRFARLMGQSDARTLRRLESGECEIRKATAILATMIRIYGPKGINMIEKAVKEVEHRFGQA